VAPEVPVIFRRILVLLVLVAALGAYLWIYEVPQAEREAKKEKLLAIDKDAVTAVTLTYPDREIDLRKDDKGWRVVKPVDAPADEAAAKALVTTLADAEVQKTLDQLPADLGSFGLDKPSVTARITLKDGSQPPPVAVGKNTAIGGKTYVRKDDEAKLYLTTSSLQYGLNKQVKDLRDKQILAFKDEDVTRVEIKPESGDPLVLTRKDKDAWTVDPGDHPADPTEVRSYLSSLRATRAVDFPDDSPADLAKYGLTSPRLAITVATGKDGAGIETLLVGGEGMQGTQKQVYAKRADQPPVYALGDWSFRTLSKTPGQFRDKTVLGFDSARVAKLVVARKDGASVTLARADGKWTVEGTEGTPKDSAIASYVDDVRDLRGADIAAEPAKDLHAFGLDQPDLSITLADKDGQPIGTVLAARHDGKPYAMRAGGDTVFEARDYMYARLDKQPKDFVETAEAGRSTTTVPAAPPADEPAGDDDAGADED
jgi:uncharacterized protein DUF4340